MTSGKFFIVDMKKFEDGQTYPVQSLAYNRFKDAIAKAIRFAQEGENRLSHISNFVDGLKRGAYIEIYSSAEGPKINTRFQPAKNLFAQFINSDKLCECEINNYYISAGLEVDPITGMMMFPIQSTSVPITPQVQYLWNEVLEPKEPNKHEQKGIEKLRKRQIDLED